jgi:hypothetical protein
MDLSQVQPVVAGLGLPFVTVDLARRGDGVWRVIDGQSATGRRASARTLSSPPSSTSADRLLSGQRVGIVQRRGT